jgi:hypothetical protein
MMSLGSRGLLRQLLADDMQLHGSCPPDDVSVLRHRLKGCVDDDDVAAAAWCVSRRLQLIGDTFEIALFGSRAGLQPVAGQILSPTVGSDSIQQPISVVRDLGV